MLRKLMFALALVIVPILVIAQVAVPTPDDPGSFLAALLLAFQAKQWSVVAILVTIGLVFVVRKFGVTYVPFLATRRGGAIVLLVASVVTSLAVPILNGTPLTLAVLYDVIVTGIVAAGGRTIFRSILLDGVAADAPGRPAPDPLRNVSPVA